MAYLERKAGRPTETAALAKVALLPQPKLFELVLEELGRQAIRFRAYAQAQHELPPHEIGYRFATERQATTFYYMIESWLEDLVRLENYGPMIRQDTVLIRPGDFSALSKKALETLLKRMKELQKG